MEALNATAMERMSADGAGWLHFGFTPFTGLSDEHELPCASRTFTRCVRLLARHGERIYPAAAQLEYKRKWAPHVVLPEYIAFRGGPGWRRCGSCCGLRGRFRGRVGCVGAWGRLCRFRCLVRSAVRSIPPFGRSCRSGSPASSASPVCLVSPAGPACPIGAARAASPVNPPVPTVRLVPLSCLSHLSTGSVNQSSPACPTNPVNLPVPSDPPVPSNPPIPPSRHSRHRHPVRRTGSSATGSSRSRGAHEVSGARTRRTDENAAGARRESAGGAAHGVGESAQSGYRALPRQRGPGLLVPVSCKGKGATALDALRVQRALGSRSPSLAVATTMHHFSMATLVGLVTDGEGLEWMLVEGVASGNRLVASGFAEGRPGPASSRPR